MSSLESLGYANDPRLFFVEGGDIPFSKPPLLALLEAGYNIFPGELIDGIRAQIQDDSDFPAVQQLLFSLQHAAPLLVKFSRANL